MILAAGTTQAIQAVMSGAPATTQPYFAVSYDDIVAATPAISPTVAGGQLNSATPVALVAAPGSGHVANVKYLNIYNVDTAPVVITVGLYTSGSLTAILLKCTLAVGDQLVYNSMHGWYVVDASGQIKTTSAATGNQVLVLADAYNRIMKSILPTGNTLLVTSGTIYACYVGRTVQAIVAASVEYYLSTVGTSTQTAEIGIFSSPSAPNKSGQTLTKICATGTVDSLTATTTVKRNTSGFAQAIPANTHVWAVSRHAMAGTQPTFRALTDDHLQGHVLTLAGGSALTGISSFAGGVPAASVLGLCPDMRVTLD